MPEQEPVPTEGMTVYVAHDYHEDKPRALFLNRDEADDYVGNNIPRGYVAAVEIDTARWVKLEEFHARKL